MSSVITVVTQEDHVAKSNYAMKQCVLEQDDRHQTVWIPSQFAKHNKIVNLKNAGDWKVSWVGNGSVMYRYLKEREDDYKRTRKASDI